MEWEPDSPCHSHLYLGQACRSQRRHRGWELERRDCGAISGRGLLLTAERQTEGTWGRRLWWETSVKEIQAAMEARQYAEPCGMGGAMTVASLFPHASISSWTVEKLGYQVPDAQNNRVGPHPGCPFGADALIYREGPQSGGPLYVPDAPNNREGPQAREPPKSLNGRSSGEKLVKQTDWSPAARACKKDSERATTPAAQAVRVPEHLVPSGYPQPKQRLHLHA